MYIYIYIYIYIFSLRKIKDKKLFMNEYSNFPGNYCSVLLVHWALYQENLNIHSRIISCPDGITPNSGLTGLSISPHFSILASLVRPISRHRIILVSPRISIFVSLQNQRIYPSHDVHHPFPLTSTAAEIKKVFKTTEVSTLGTSSLFVLLFHQTTSYHRHCGSQGLQYKYIPSRWKEPDCFENEYSIFFNLRSITD